MQLSAPWPSQLAHAASHAAQAPEGEEEDVFDYDAHIARLIANAGSGHLHDDDDDDDEGWDSDAETADGGPRGDVDAAFDAALADYDSDEDEYDDDDEDHDDGVASGVARIALEEAGGVLEAMMDADMRRNYRALREPRT